MSRMAFLTRVLTRSHDAPPSRSTGGLRRAGVFLHQVEPFDGHEQLVLAGVAKLEEFLLGVADADLLQADEDADPVIDVHDEIADLEIAQIGEERLRDRAPLVGRATLFLEDVGLGVDLQAGVRQPKPPRQRAERHEHGRVPRIVGTVDLNGQHVVFLEQLDRALGPARRRGDEDGRLACLAQLPDCGHEVSDAAMQLDGGLAGDVMRVGRRDPARRRRCPGKACAATWFQSANSASGAGGCLVTVLRLLVAVLQLVEKLRDVGVHLVAFGDDDAGIASAGQVVEDRRAAVVTKDVAQRHDGQLIDRRHRSLRAGVVRAERLDRVADELEAHRVSGAGRENVQDAATARELTVFVGRILAAEAGIDEQVGQIVRRDVLSRLQVDRRLQNTRRRADTRQQRRRRRDDDASRAARQRVQRHRPDRRDADVRRHPAIGIDLVRRHRQDRAVDGRRRQSLERRQEEPDIRDRGVQVAVARHDVQHDAVGQRVGRRRDEQRLRRPR